MREDHHSNHHYRMKDHDHSHHHHRPCSNSVSGKKRKEYAESSSNNNIARTCTECGKKFWSWKALFGHMRCHPERQWRGINPPPNFRKQQQHFQTSPHSFINNMTPEDHEVAACLILLANSKNNKASSSLKFKAVATMVDDSSMVVDQDNCNNGQFVCSCCNKVFGSHQALGGHRASHKNVKGCFANTTTSPTITASTTNRLMTWTPPQGVGDHAFLTAASDHHDDQHPMNMMMVPHARGGGGDGYTNAAGGDVEGEISSSSIGGGHKCSICLRVFTTGQALGGHKRCHWEKGETTTNAPPPSTQPPTFDSSSTATATATTSNNNNKSIDLNFPFPPLPPPPPPDDDDHPHSSSPLTLDLRYRIGLTGSNGADS